MSSTDRRPGRGDGSKIGSTADGAALSVQTQRGTVPLALEVIAMSKRFGTFVALDQVAQGVHTGSMHALLGENGAGKSTLVKCIMGYYRPDDGDLLVWGRERTLSKKTELRSAANSYRARASVRPLGEIRASAKRRPPCE